MKCCLQILVAIVVASAATLANAQDREWRITPYAWIAGFDGTVGTFGGGSGLPGRIDVDTGSLSDNMELGGFMLHLGWRRGRLCLARAVDSRRRTASPPSRTRASKTSSSPS